MIVNDHLDIALACADGVHLGQEDFPIAYARSIAPTGWIIGASAHHHVEAIEAQAAGATYIGMGCLFTSVTKRDASPITQQEIELTKAHLRIPLCVIGGIDQANIVEALCAKPEMVAVCSSVWREDSPLLALQHLQQIFAHSSVCGVPHSSSDA